jgi:hypothetical protein
MLIKSSRVRVLFLMAISLFWALPVSTLAGPVVGVEIDIGRKSSSCKRAGVCHIGVSVGWEFGRTVKGNAQVQGRTMSLSFNGELPEKADSLPIDEDIVLDSATSKALGFKTVTVLKGNYKINRNRGNKLGTLSLNVKTTK